MLNFSKLNYEKIRFSRLNHGFEFSCYQPIYSSVHEVITYVPEQTGYQNLNSKRKYDL